MSRGLFNLDDWDNMDESAELDLNILNDNINEDVSIPVPGGLSEHPSGKPYDLSSISIPSGTTITADQYNDAMKQVQKSFKEGYEIIGMLLGANIVESTDDFFDDIMNEAVDCDCGEKDCPVCGDKKKSKKKKKSDDDKDDKDDEDEKDD